MTEMRNADIVMMSRRKLALLLSVCVLVASFMTSFFHETKVLSRSLTATLRNPAAVPAIPSLTLYTPTIEENATPLKVLVAIPCYETKNRGYMEDMLDSMRDMCEAGLQITLALYLTSNTPLSEDETYMLNARMQCRHPRGSFKTKVIYLHPNTGKAFARPHRDLFFENVDKFDLFLYIEDDMMIRLGHIVAYIEETKKLKTLVGEEDFYKYSIGFLRYEVNFQTHARTQFEHPDADFKIVEDPKLGDMYMTHPSAHHHQAMYMATPDQLLAWKNSCECFRDTVKMQIELDPMVFRENLSSSCLFGKCHVLPVFPRDSFQDLMIHHMSDKYVKGVVYAGVNNVLKTATVSTIFKGAGKPRTSDRNGFIVNF